MSNNSSKPINGHESSEEEFTPVGDGVLDLTHNQTPPSDDHDDERDEHDEHDEEESGEDSRLSAGANEEEDDERERLRAFRKKRRKRAKENINRDRLELKYLRDRNDELERRVSAGEAKTQGIELQNVDNQMAQLRQQIQLADNVIAGAIESNEPGRGKDLVEAQRIRDQLRDGLNKLETFKRANSGEVYSESGPGATQPARTVAPVISPVQKRRAGKWFNENSWYNPQGNNPESKKVLEIDREITAEGYDPSTEEYWDEFEDRVQEALPNLYTSSENEADTPQPRTRTRPNPPPKTPNGGPRISVGGKERPLRKGEVFISRDRREALEKAGVWDDPKLRAKYLKRYAQYDLEHGSSN